MSIRRSVLKRDSHWSLEERAKSIVEASSSSSSSGGGGGENSGDADDLVHIQFLHCITLKRNADAHVLESLNRTRTTLLLSAIARSLNYCCENVSTHDLQSEPRRRNRHFTLKLNEDLDSTDEDEDDGAPRPFRSVMQTAGEILLGRFFFLPYFDSVMRAPLREYTRGQARHLTEIAHRMLFDENPLLCAGTMFGICIYTLHWIHLSRPIFRDGAAAESFQRLVRLVRVTTDEYCTVVDGPAMNAQLFGLGMSAAKDCETVFKHLRTYYENYLAAQDDPFKADLRRLVHSINHFLVLCGEPVVLTHSLMSLMERESSAREGLLTFERDSFLCFMQVVMTNFPEHGSTRVFDGSALAALHHDESYVRSGLVRAEESKWQFIKRAFASASIAITKDVRQVALVQPLICRPPSASTTTTSSIHRSYAADPELAKQRFFQSGHSVVKEPCVQLIKEEASVRSGLTRAEKDMRMLVMLQEQRIREGWLQEAAPQKVLELESALGQPIEDCTPSMVEDLQRLRTKEAMRRSELQRLEHFELDLIFRQWFADTSMMRKRCAELAAVAIELLETQQEESRCRLVYLHEEARDVLLFLMSFTLHPYHAMDSACENEEASERREMEAHEQRGRRAIHSLAVIDRRSCLAALHAASDHIADEFAVQAAVELLLHTHALEQLALQSVVANDRDALIVEQDAELLALEKEAKLCWEELLYRSDISNEESTVFDCCIVRVFEVETRYVRAEQEIWRACEEDGDRHTSAVICSQHAALVQRLEESVASLVPLRPAGSAPIKRPGTGGAQQRGAAATAIAPQQPSSTSATSSASGTYTRPFSSRWRVGKNQQSTVQ